MCDIEKLQCLTDLHLHLDGAISVKNARKLAEIQKIDIPESDEELERLLMVSPDCRDLNEFLTKFEFPGSLMQTEKGISWAVYNLLEELNEQGVIYAELRLAPQKHTLGGLNQEQVVLAAIDGISRSQVHANLILCCMRDKDNRNENLETARLCEKYLGKGVGAIDLAGAEAVFPTEDFSYIFSYAKILGVPITIHAGEAAGAGSVAVALECGAKRIGHGVRAVENEEVMKALKESGAVLELCPTSNLITHAVESISEYPLRKFMNYGIPVTVNTDDPSVCGTDIRKEWQLLIDEFYLSNAEVKRMLITSADAAFADETEKDWIRRMINNNFYGLDKQ